MIWRKKKNNQAEEHQELSPSDLAYFTPELKQAKIELDKRKNAMNDFFLQAMTQGIKIKLENERESQWHSVKDKPTGDGTPCLVWHNDDFGYEIAKYANGRWIMYGCHDVTPLVQYWMPLTEPPKDEED